jgi:hypothetical protein
MKQSKKSSFMPNVLLTFSSDKIFILADSILLSAANEIELPADNLFCGPEDVWYLALDDAD